MFEQVREVAEEDLIVVPHGSQNVNLLFARKGAVVIEVRGLSFTLTFLSSLLRSSTLNSIFYLDLQIFII